MISLFTSQVTVWLRLLMSSLHQFLNHSQNWRMFELVYSERLYVSNCESCQATSFGRSLGSHLQECLYLPFSWWLDLPLPIWNFPLQDSGSFFTCTTQLILSQLMFCNIFVLFVFASYVSKVRHAHYKFKQKQIIKNTNSLSSVLFQFYQPQISIVNNLLSILPDFLGQFFLFVLKVSLYCIMLYTQFYNFF